MTKRTPDAAQALEEASKRPEDTYILRLYVTGMTPRSIRAIENLRAICDEYLPGRYDLEVIDIYQQPTSRAVAEFIGGMNFLPATVTAESAASITLEVAALGRATIARPPGLNGSRAATVGVRPERMTLLVDHGASAARQVAGRIADAAYYGDMTYYYVALAGLAEPVVVSMRNAVGRRILAIGEAVEVGWAPESLVPLA